jgi:hypothetical protein
VFANVVDPVGAGFVASLARPGGNVTGFASYEFGFPIKWLELLKQMRADRWRQGEPDLRGVLAHRVSALRRLHGQLPGTDRDLPHRRQ